MGKYDSVITLALRTQSYLKASGKSNMLLTKALPKGSISIEGLRLAKNSVGDICSFKSVDRTLYPKFLDELMALDDADTIKFATTVTDKMLKKMRYSHPEKIKVLSGGTSAFDMTFNFGNGTLKIGEVAHLSKAEKIVVLRHELDHFDKAAKLYKAVGGKKYAEALAKRFPNELVVVDHNFWGQMSKNADIDVFDVKRFLSAWENPKFKKVSGSQDFTAIRNTHEYAVDAFEASAYGKQKQIQRALGLSDKVLADAYGEPLGNVIRYLDDLGVPDERKMQIYIELQNAAIFSGSSSAKLLMSNYKNILNKNISDDLKPALKELNRFYDGSELYVLVKRMENYLNQGCYSIDDILAKGLV